MTNRNSVMKELEECLSASCRGFWTCPYDKEWDAVRAAYDLLKEQEPRLLNIDEVKGVAYEESYRIRGEDCNPVWLERWDDAFTGLQLVLIGWMYEPDSGYSPEDYDFYSMHFGSDIHGVLPYKQFGKTWRVWNKMPTMEQRKAAKW